MVPVHIMNRDFIVGQYEKHFKGLFSGLLFSSAVVFIIQRDVIILDSTLCFAVQRVQLKARVSVLVYIMEDFSYLNKMGEILKIFL